MIQNQGGLQRPFIWVKMMLLGKLVVNRIGRDKNRCDRTM